MTVEPVSVTQPKHPIDVLTTYELARYRRDLEHALAVLPEPGAVRELFQGKLAEVLAEQQSRTAVASAPRG